MVVAVLCLYKECASEQGPQSYEQEPFFVLLIWPRVRNSPSGMGKRTERPRPTERPPHRQTNHTNSIMPLEGRSRLLRSGLRFSFFTRRDARTTKTERRLECLSALRWSSAPPMTVSSVPASQLIIHMGWEFEYGLFHEVIRLLRGMIRQRVDISALYLHFYLFFIHTYISKEHKGMDEET